MSAPTMAAVARALREIDSVAARAELPKPCSVRIDTGRYPEAVLTIHLDAPTSVGAWAGALKLDPPAITGPPFSGDSYCRPWIKYLAAGTYADLTVEVWCSVVVEVTVSAPELAEAGR